MDKLRQAQDKICMLEQVQGQGPTMEVMREIRWAGGEIDYWQGLYEKVVPNNQWAMSYSQMRGLDQSGQREQ